MNTWAKDAEALSPSVIAGKISEENPRLPVGGNSGKVKANSWMSTSPTQNTGSDAWKLGMALRAEPSQRKRVVMANAASSTAPTTEKSKPSPATAKVAGSA